MLQLLLTLKNLVKLVNLLNLVNLLKLANFVKLANIGEVLASELKKILGGQSRWWQLSKRGGNTSELILIAMLAPTIIVADAYISNLHVSSNNK